MTTMLWILLVVLVGIGGYCVGWVLGYSRGQDDQSPITQLLLDDHPNCRCFVDEHVVYTPEVVEYSEVEEPASGAFACDPPELRQPPYFSAAMHRPVDMLDNDYLDILEEDLPELPPIIRRWLQANRNGQPVEMWLGISTDEAARMRPSDVAYITNRWPLIERGMSRTDCAVWLQQHDLEIPSKSACTFCPYHSTAEWRHVRSTPRDWVQAVRVDAAIRNLRPPRPLFVHPARIPLDQIDFRTEEERGQYRLWDDECTGLCGL